MKLAEQHNLAIYVTNQVMANPATMFGDPTTAIGGHIVGHACTYRIYLRRGKKDSRVAKLIDSHGLRKPAFYPIELQGHPCHVFLLLKFCFCEMCKEKYKEKMN